MNIDDYINLYTPEERLDLTKRLAWNADFCCFTKLGFELLVWPAIRKDARWILYFDVDHVHKLNKKFGDYERVNAMIRSVFESLRSTDYVAGQKQSGDEFLVCLIESAERERLDPMGAKNRLVEALKEQGLTATFAIIQVTSTDLQALLKPAIEAVNAEKKLRGRSR